MYYQLAEKIATNSHSISTTYAAVAATISTLRASVKTDSSMEKMAIKAISTPRRFNMLFIKYRTMVAATSIIDDAAVAIRPIQ